MPAAIIACVGGGSNAIGIFHDFIGDKKVKLIGVEAGGRGDKLGDHAARFRGGLPGVLQGTYSYVLQDAAGQIAATHSVSAGLDYPSIGPEHAWLADTKRAEYVAASDTEALDACKLLAQTEGIIPALESAHAVAEVMKRAPGMKKSEVVIVNVSGRGDKDIGILREKLESRWQCSMKRFWITLAVALPAVALFWIAVMHFDRSCGEEVMAQQPSPNGRYVAVLMERNCGATTRYVEHINLRRTDRKFSSSFFSGTINDGEVFTLENRSGGGSVEFEWVGNLLKIHYPADEGVFKRQSSWNDVEIAYVF